MKKEKKGTGKLLKVIEKDKDKPARLVQTMTHLVEISLIDLTGWNPRCEDSFKDEEFEELKQSMKENGFFKHEPLLVRPAVEAFRFQLIAGHRRLQAAKELGLTEVPVCIQDINDQDTKLLIFIDNFHRKDFSPLEEAQGMKMILDDGAITQTDLAKKMGKSQSYVANRLRLLEAPEELKEKIISREISPGHIMVLLPYVGYPVFDSIFESMKEQIDNNGSVSIRELEGEVIENGIDNCDSVLDLDRFPYDTRHVREFFDFRDCETCQHVVTRDFFGNPERHCLNQVCWFSRMTAAGELYNKSVEDRKKKVLESSPEDLKIDELKYGEYETLMIKYHPWIKDCEGCDKRRTSDGKEMGSEICLDPACYKKNDAAWEKEQQKLAREEEKKSWEMFDSKLKNLTFFEDQQARWLLNNLADKLWDDAARVGLSIWDKAKKGERDPDVSKVPDEDIYRAMVRLVVAQEFVGCKPTIETMNKFLEGLGV